MGFQLFLLLIDFETRHVCLPVIDPVDVCIFPIVVAVLPVVAVIPPAPVVGLSTAFIVPAELI